MYVGFVLHFVVVYGSPVTNHGHICPHRFLLLLCEKVNSLSQAHSYNLALSITNASVYSGVVALAGSRCRGFPLGGVGRDAAGETNFVGSTILLYPHIFSTPKGAVRKSGPPSHRLSFIDHHHQFSFGFTDEKKPQLMHAPTTPPDPISPLVCLPSRPPRHCTNNLRNNGTLHRPSPPGSTHGCSVIGPPTGYNLGQIWLSRRHSRLIHQR